MEGRSARYPDREGATVTRPLLRGRPGEWPLAGHVLGSQTGAPLTCDVHWAGRVAAGASIGVAWRASRILEEAVRHGVREGGDARSTLKAVWEALESVVPSQLGPELGRDLSLLLVAKEGESLLVSAVGVGRIDVIRGGHEEGLRPWLQGSHPLLVAPGLPERAPGALQIPARPAWLVGTVWGEAAPASERGVAAAFLARCGVHA